MNIDFTALEKLFEARKAAKHYFSLHADSDDSFKKFKYAPGKVTNDSYETLILEEILRLATQLKATKS